jgi:hypothetical protein
MLAQLSPMDKVSIVAISRAIQAETRTHTIGALAAQLGVPLMTESRHRQQFMKKILAQPTEHAASSVPTYVTDLIKILCHRSVNHPSGTHFRRSIFFRPPGFNKHDPQTTPLMPLTPREYRCRSCRVAAQNSLGF